MEQPDQQDRRDHYRTFTITFPADLQAKQAQAWLHTLVGTLSANAAGPLNRPTIVLELVATGGGLHHQLRAPSKMADIIAAQLRTLVPGIRVTPGTNLVDRTFKAAVELGTSRPAGTLSVPSSEHLAASLLGSLQGLQGEEAIVLQWVLAPAARQEPPNKKNSGTVGMLGISVTLGGHDGDELHDRRAKLERPNFLGVLRVAADAATVHRARQLLDHVKAGLGSTCNANTWFVRRITFSKKALFRRITDGSGLLLYPARVAVPELVGLTGWPIGSPHVAGLPQGRSRQLAAPATVPHTGRVIGTSNFPGAERPVALSYKDATKHLHVIGPTGTGKTTLLANMAAQDMQQGYGVVVLESKGDLFDAVLDRVPRERIKDVIVLDVNDTATPVGFNILNAGTASSAVDELSALVTGLYGDNGGVYAPMLLYYGLHALAATPGSTFIDLPVLLSPQSPEETAWRDHVVTNVKNRDVRQFWRRYLDDRNKERDRMAAPVHNRIWQLAVRPEIRNVIGQSTSSFTFEEVLRDNKILLINLAGVRVGEQTASLVGTLLMNALYSAVRTVKKTKPSFLYLDEFQDFVNLPVPASDMLAKLRSFGLGLVLAHQDLDQLAKVRGLEQAVLANARSKVVFQTSARDARVMQREFGRLVDEDDFINLAAYEAIVRIATDEGMSTPVSITTAPPSKPTNVATAVKSASRAAYGRPIAQVEAEIEARRRVADEKTRKPKLGTQRWGHD